jgi:hypothetical protein
MVSHGRLGGKESAHNFIISTAMSGQTCIFLVAAANLAAANFRWLVEFIFGGGGGKQSVLRLGRRLATFAIPEF